MDSSMAASSINRALQMITTDLKYTGKPRSCLVLCNTSDLPVFGILISAVIYQFAE